MAKSNMKKLVNPLNIRKTIEAMETLDNWHEIVDKEMIVMWLRQNLAIGELACDHSSENLRVAISKRKLFESQQTES